MLPELQQIIDKVTRYGTKQIGHAQGQTRAQGDALLGVANIMSKQSGGGVGKAPGQQNIVDFGAPMKEEPPLVQKPNDFTKEANPLKWASETEAKAPAPIPGSGSLLPNYTQGGVGTQPQPSWESKKFTLPTPVTTTGNTISNI